MYDDPNERWRLLLEIAKTTEKPDFTRYQFYMTENGAPPWVSYSMGKIQEERQGLSDLEADIAKLKFSKGKT